MAIPNIDTRKLILPWDDAGILGGLDHYLKIPEDVRLHAGWIFAIGPDKTHVLGTDADGNLKVAVESSVASASNVGLLDHSGNPITNTNPLPVSQHSAAVAYVGMTGGQFINGTGGTTLLAGLVANLKITLFTVTWAWVHVTTTYPQNAHWWANIKGNTSGTVFPFYESFMTLAADPGNAPTISQEMPFNPPLELSKIMNGTETSTLLGYCDTQQVTTVYTLHGYV